MSWALVCKVFQKKFFDLLTYKSGVIATLFFLFLFAVGLLHFGEVLVWYFYKSSFDLAQFIDNIGGRSFHGRLCQKLPIDVVYTWVNGSDPVLIRQLHELKKTVAKMENVSSSIAQVCTLPDCIPANGLVIEHDVTNEELLDIFISANIHPKIFEISKSRTQTSCVLFESKGQLNEVISLNLSMKEDKIKSISQLFYTSDGSNINSQLREGLILALGLPEIVGVSPKNILSKFGNFVSDFVVDTASGIASFYIQDKETCKLILNEKNFTISGKIIRFLQGYLVWNLGMAPGVDNEVMDNRFRDMDELKFSLRSLEKFAPWVRHVFIVTNGQIPSWLDLSNPRISVIVHEDIFTDSSHLPTFSSPAIESHLHRIPGLSEHFLYLNDDIFFGSDVWPDDFVAEDGTQSIYLTYAVPDCKVGCPGSWIRDGYCDKACNCSECEWDGGDCSNATSSRNQYGFAQSHGHFPWSDSINSQYCHPGCADNWIADRYCDVSCNTYKCGFDAGDCGLENFNKIQSVPLRRNQSDYSYDGYSVLQFELFDLFEVYGNVEGGEYHEEPIVRRFSYVNSSKLLTMVLKSNHSRSSLMVSLNFKNKNSMNFTYNFTVSVDTLIDEKNVTISKTIFSKVNETIKPSPPLIVNPVPIPRKGGPSQETFNMTFDLEKYILPPFLKENLTKILAKYNEGMLTRKGLQIAKTNILIEYFIKNNLEWTESSLANFFQNMATSSDYEKDKDNAIIPNSKLDPQPSVNSKNIFVSSGKIDILNDSKSPQIKELKQLNKDSTTIIRHLLQYDIFPWEKRGVFYKTLVEKEEEKATENKVWRGRHLMDAFADSIRHVNRIYNQAYGYFSRKVPAHSAHFFNKKILNEMFSKFYEEFQLTSSHKVRSSSDMQLAFSYYYFLMSEKKSWTLEEIFDEFDLDRSGVLSDRELRLLMARTHKLPLFLKELMDLESNLLNCSIGFKGEKVENPELYHESKLPQVTLNFVMNCSNVIEFLQKSFSDKNRFKYRIISDGDSFVSFKMIRNNATAVVRQLDDIRKNMKKFVCLNDDMDDSNDPKGAEDVRSIIKDFYLTFFPKPSQFELKDSQQNEFNNMAEYHEIRRFDTIKACSVIVFIVALTFIILTTMKRFRCRKFATFRVRYM